MQVVIDILEKDYDDILNGETKASALNYATFHAIRNGTPLPKGHGRLGDLDALEKEMTCGIKAGNLEEGYEEYENINTLDDCVDTVRYADTIIEADHENTKEADKDEERDER